MTASSNLGDVGMPPWVRELVAAGLRICWAVMPAHATFYGFAADPAPIALTVLAGHVVATSILFRFKVTPGAALGAECRGMRSSLTYKSRLVCFAVAVLPVCPRVVKTKFSSTASLTFALHVGLGSAPRASVWSAKPPTCWALSQVLVCMLCRKKMQLADNIGLICQQGHYLVCCGDSSRVQIAATSG